MPIMRHVTRHADKAIRRMRSILAHVVCRPMHSARNIAVCEQAPTADFVSAWLVSPTTPSLTAQPEKVDRFSLTI